MRTISVVGVHAAGEIGNVIVGGVLPPPGATVFEQMQALQRDGDALRRLLLREPRGSVAAHGNLIVPSTRDDCDAGFIIMEPTEYPPMSGSNTICTTTVLLETGMLPMHEPETVVRLEAPGGVVEARASCRDGRCESVEFTNVPCFADRIDAPLEVAGVGTLSVDVAYGGMFYAIADAAALGFAIEPDEARELSLDGRAHPRRRARAAAVRAPREPRDPRRLDRADRGALAGRRRRHAQCRRGRARSARPQPDRHGPLRAHGGAARARPHAAGRCDVALLRDRHRLRRPDRLGGARRRARGIVPAVRGSAWITGLHQYLVDPSDPFPEGYLVADTWGVSGADTQD